MTCLICNTPSTSFEDKVLKKTFFHCPNCEAIFLEPKFYLDAQTEKGKYKQHNNSLENEGYVKMFEDFMDFFWKDLVQKKGLEALDFGCGPGPVLATLLERKDLHVDKYDPFFYPKSPRRDKKYSLITSTEVFEHLQHPLEVFQNLANSLDKDGLLALMTHFHYNDLERFLQWWYRRDPTHIVFYTPKTFEFMANKCNLHVQAHDNKRIITFKKK